MTRASNLARAGLLTVVLLLGVGRPALAWDPATTHSGLTQRALWSSNFHATLARHLGRPLGGFEPLRFDAGAIEPELARTLKDRLARLDPAGGYRPNDDGVATAAAWVQAGAVLEKTPPERGRHHFFEPGKRSGLDDGPGLSGEAHAARLTLDDGGTVRDLATGLSFTLEGMSALDWLRSPRNELGLGAFFDQWERAASAQHPVERETALVRALLALGGSLAVLEDMGQPAYVRNDFRGEFLSNDAGSEFERFVADRYGGVALPHAAGPVVRPDVESFFVAADGKGLAQRTQERFFSVGTLPRDIRVGSGSSSSELLRVVNQSLPFPTPVVTTLDVRQGRGTRYLVNEGMRVLAYRHEGDQVHFFLDRAVYADYARRWLPEIAGYAAGMINHLLRVQLALTVEEQKVAVVAAGLVGKLSGATKLYLLAEDADGVRKQIGEAPLSTSPMGPFAVPSGTRKVAAYVRGQDAGGVFVAAAESSLP